MSRFRAVIDLGSNSFHLLTARRLSRGWAAQERIKRKVQLLSGFQDDCLSPEAIKRGLDCIGVFAQRIRALDPADVSVMGTCALRLARNRAAFADPASELLGVPVRIITGQEEARLIFVGVTRTLTERAGERCVIDIGGGSTEFAIGAASRTEDASRIRDGDGGGLRITPRVAASVGLGCVAASDRFLAPGVPVPVGYPRARDAARTLLRDARDRGELPRISTDVEVVGTSGTIESVLTVLDANGWSEDRITRDGLDRIESALTGTRAYLDGALPGLPPERADIFPAGVAILSAIFAEFGIETMHYVGASLQDGMLLELIGEDERAGQSQRTLTIEALQERFQVDRDQASRVGQTAERLYEDTVAGWWGPGDDACRHLLRWAAAVHEIGQLIDAMQYHRHGAYVIKSHEMRGFSAEEKRRLALMVRGHRRSFPGLAFRAFSTEVGLKLRRLIALLRVSVILNRSRTDGDMPALTAAARGDELRVGLPNGWLNRHRLSRDELQVETRQLAEAGLKLVVEEE